MSQIDPASIKTQIAAILNNPSQVVDFAFDLFDNANNNTLDIITANNPFAYALEFAALTSSAVFQATKDQLSAFYPKLAQTEDDLYRWMSDADYANRFVTPSRLPVNFIFNADEVRTRAVKVASGSVDDTNAIYSKMVIPRNSQLTAMGYDFSLQYPIEIRVMKHGGFVVVYDVSEPTPLLSLETNLLDFTLITSNGVDYISINVPLDQFTAVTYRGTITASSGFKATYPLNTQQFYYVRVFTRANDTLAWTEASVTHNALIYDPAVLTFVAKVLETSVVVTLPEVYVTNGLGLGAVRVDVLTSEGAIVLETLALQASAIQAKWLDFDYENGSLSPFAAPLTVFTEKTITITESLSGGVNGITLADLQQRVIYDANRTNLPITPAQLSTYLTDLGYGVLKSEDVVTDRVYQATRALTVQTNKTGIATAVGAGIVTLQASMAQLVTNSAVRDNGSRVTITPKALYALDNGIYSLVSDATLTGIQAMGLADRIAAINEKLFLYTPFYYVLDANNSTFVTRAYELDNPSNPSRVFTAENNSLGVQLTADTFTVVKGANGYEITLVTASDSFYQGLDDQNVACQLLYTPQGESDYAYLNGMLLGRTTTNERIFRFYLNTNYDLTALDELILTSFGQYGNTPSAYRALLTNTFTVLSCIAKAVSPNPIVLSNSDTKLGNKYLDREFVVVTEQQYTIKFGSALTDLYTRSRDITSDTVYALWANNVYWTYPGTVYQRDPTTNQLVFDTAGNPVVLHAKGDFILDAEGNQQIQFHKGDIKTDSAGNPLPLNDRVVMHEFDVVALDGVYYFTQNALDQAYISQVMSDLVSWVTSDMVAITKKLLNLTKVRLRPKQTLGLISVIANATLQQQLSAAISFNVTYYLTDVGYKNTSLRANLETITHSVIATLLENATFSVSDLVRALAVYTTGDVVDIFVDNFGANKDLTVVTCLDDTMRCAIQKRIDLATDNTLTVVEAVTTTFLKHKTAA